MTEASDKDEPPSPTAAAKRPPAWRSIVLRLGVTALTLGLWYWLADVPWVELQDAVERIHLSTLGWATALACVNLCIGAYRWRVLMTAYGAVELPPYLDMVRLYFVGIFFNTFIPANVGGDLLRGHITRKAFPGAASGYLVVLLERVFGLAGLMLLAGGVLLVHPIAELPVSRWLGALGFVAALGAATAPAIVRRFGGRLPGKLGELAATAPTLERPALVVAVLLLSVVTQGLVAVGGHLYVADLDPSVALSASLVLVPVALMSIYLPTIAGLGAREASFVFLFGLIGVHEADATAAGLGVLATTILTALIGAVPLVRGRLSSRVERVAAEQSSEGGSK